MLSVDPADGSPGVGRTVSLQARFSADVDAAVVRASPLWAMPGDTRLQLRIGAGITDRDGAALANGQDVRFGTAAQAVCVGAPAQGDAVLANDPMAVVDPSGNVTLGWFAWHRVGGADDFVLAANQLR